MATSGTYDRSDPFVTVAIPCRNEAGYIQSCLESVLAQDYPEGRTEIVVADGMSDDGTRQVLKAVATVHPRVQVIDNPDRLQSAGMNAVIRRARGEVIVRMDVHCEYAPDYLRRCVEELARSGADNVGGAQRPRATSFFQGALCAALTSFLGVGGARYRSEQAQGLVDTVFLGAFRRRVFEIVGLYDPRAITNEDAELNQRLLEAGGRIHLSRAIVVHYHPRGSFRALARQYFRYGQGRARTLVKHRRLAALRPAVPFLALCALALALALPSVRPYAPWAIGVYSALCLAEAWRVGHPIGSRAVGTILGIFPTLHVSHAIGFALGLGRYLVRPDWVPAERLEPRLDDGATRPGSVP